MNNSNYRHRFIINSRKRRHVAISIEPEVLYKRRHIINEPLTSLQWKLLSQPSMELSIGEIKVALDSDDEESLRLGMGAARDVLNRLRSAPADDIASTCIRLLKADATSSRQLQFVTAWTLSCVATGSSCQTGCLIEFQSKSVFLTNEAIQALTLMAAEGAETRDYLIRHNVIEGILALINAETPLLVLRNIVWLISNLCLNIEDIMTLEQVKRLLPVVAQLLDSQDVQVLTAACRSVAHITCCDDNDTIQAVIDAQMVSSLERLLRADDPAISELALCCVNNIFKKSDKQTDLLTACPT